MRCIIFHRVRILIAITAVFCPLTAWVPAKHQAKPCLRPPRIAMSAIPMKDLQQHDVLSSWRVGDLWQTDHFSKQTTNMKLTFLPPSFCDQETASITRVRWIQWVRWELDKKFDKRNKIPRIHDLQGGRCWSCWFGLCTASSSSRASGGSFWSSRWRGWQSSNGQNRSGTSRRFGTCLHGIILGHWWYIAWFVIWYLRICQWYLIYHIHFVRIILWI